MSATIHEPQPDDVDSNATTYEPVTLQSSGGSDPHRRVNLPQEILDRYNYIADISSSGAQADIIFCRDKVTGAEVAIKLYRGQVEGLDLSVIEKLRAADPKHVTPILDFHHGVWTYEVQEHFAKGSLQDLFSRPGELPLSRDRMLDVVREVAAALEHIHSLDIVHRDLKPANILIRSLDPLDLVLADFGVARQQAVTRKIGSRAGTVAYMAPEASANQSGQAGDWWALGLLIVEGLSGRHLFADGQGNLLPDGVILAQLNQWGYAVPDLGDPRWTSLATGLLVQPKAHRFGAKEVGSWLTGGDPKVWAGRKPATTAKPVVFRGITCNDPESLAVAMRQNGTEALDLLATPERAQDRDRMASSLIAWDLPKDEVENLVPRQLDGALSPTVRLLRLQMLLDPASPAAYLGVQLDNNGFRSQWKAATKGDTKAQMWITAIRRDDVLTELATLLHGGAHLGTAGDLLRRWWHRLTTESAFQRHEATSLHSALEGHLLAAAFDASARRDLDAKNASALRDRKDLPPWCAAMADLAAGDRTADAFGLRTVAALVVPGVQKAERARLSSERVAARSRRIAEIRRAAWANGRAGFMRWLGWGVPVAFAAATGSTVAFSDPINPVLYWWFGAALVIGAVAGAVLPRFVTSAAAAVMAVGLMVQLPEMAYSIEHELGGVEPWLPLAKWFIGAGIAGHVAGLLSASRDIKGRFAGAAKILAGVGFALVMASLVSYMATTSGVLPSTTAGLPPAVVEGYATVADWLEPVADAQPAWAFPWGAWLAYAACALALVVAPRVRQLKDVHVVGLRGASGLWALFVSLGHIGLLLGPVVVLGTAALGALALALILWIGFSMAAS